MINLFRAVKYPALLIPCSFPEKTWAQVLKVLNSYEACHPFSKSWPQEAVDMYSITTIKLVSCEFRPMDLVGT